MKVQRHAKDMESSANRDFLRRATADAHCAVRKSRISEGLSSRDLGTPGKTYLNSDPS